MHDESSKIWVFGPPLSLLVLAGVCYFRVPEFTAFVDGRFPVVKEQVAVWEPRVRAQLNSFLASNSAPVPAALRTPVNAEGDAAPVPTAILTAESVAALEPINLAQLIANPSQWPKTVILRKPTTFPAVLDGKKVGNLTAPAGAEANLKMLKGGKLGLEYQGGGAWLAPEEVGLKPL